MQKIKKWFLRLLVVLIALAMIGVLLVMLINNRVKSQTKDDILYAMQADMEINAVSKQNNIMRIRKKAGPAACLRLSKNPPGFSDKRLAVCCAHNLSV